MVVIFVIIKRFKEIYFCDVLVVKVKFVMLFVVEFFGNDFVCCDDISF